MDRVELIEGLFLLESVPRIRQQMLVREAAVADGHMTREEARREACREQGICSERECNQPIAGWIGYGPKLCMEHLFEPASVEKESAGGD